MEAFLMDLFVGLVNMSITSGIVIVFVLFVRLFLKKVPKTLSYSLWSIVLFRLVCPFSFSSAFSILLPAGGASGKMEYIPSNIGTMAQPQINTGINGANQAFGASLPAAAPYASANPMQIVLFVLTVIWIFGIAALLFYSLVAFLKLKHRICTATLLKDNVFECGEISSPFVLGILKPKIYLPTGLSDSDRSYILMHEQIHIRRLDHLIKPIAFLVLCFHWFNPLIWLGFILMTKDMEMSCDERVLKTMGKDARKEYSSTLLSLAVKPGSFNAVPIAFGESGVGTRIKNILNYKKPAFWMAIAATAVVIAAGLVLAANPFAKEPDSAGLGVKQAAAEVSRQKSLILRTNAGGGVPVSGTVFGAWLDHVSGRWQDDSSSMPQDVKPSYILYINPAEGYKISFYEEKKAASITYGNKAKNYRIAAGDIDWIRSRHLISNYFIPREILAAVLDGTKSVLQSVQDAPNVGNYRILQISEEKYFMYENSGKYYVEQPYRSIMEIGEAVYKEALPFAAEEVLKPAVPAWTPEQTIGADMAMLDYASDDRVIFHGYFGLYVYDLKKAEFTRSLDLVPIKCNMTQGDSACEVSVSGDGNIVQLHPMSSPNMYVYTVSDNTLQEVLYTKMKGPFGSRFVTAEEAVKPVGANYSYRAVKFENNEYGILNTKDWTLGTLYYLRGDKVYTLFRSK